MSKTGHYLREWRKYRKLTQAEIAPLIGIDRSYYSKIESGVRQYDQSIIEKAAMALECRVIDLLGIVPGQRQFIQIVHEDAAPFVYDDLKSKQSLRQPRRPKKQAHRNDEQ
jgi:transcriptional regulator with XRE-family HTH domain